MTYPGGRPNSSWYTYQTVGSGLRDLGRMLYQQQRDKIGDQRYEDERAREAMARRSEDLSRPGASSFAPWLQGSLQRDAAAGLPEAPIDEVPPIDISNIANAAAPSAPIEFRPPETRKVPLPPVGGVERADLEFQPPSPYMTPEGVVMDPEMGRQAQMGQIAEEELFRQSMQPEVPLPPRNIDPLSPEGIAAAREKLENELELEKEYGVIRGRTEDKPMTYADAVNTLLKQYGERDDYNNLVWPANTDMAWRDKAAKALIAGETPPPAPSGGEPSYLDWMSRNKDPHLDPTREPGWSVRKDPTAPQASRAGGKIAITQEEYAEVVRQLVAQGKSEQEAKGYADRNYVVR